MLILIQYAANHCISNSSVRNWMCQLKEQNLHRLTMYYRMTQIWVCISVNLELLEGRHHIRLPINDNGNNYSSIEWCDIYLLFCPNKTKSPIGSHTFLHTSQRISALFYGYSLRLKTSVFNSESSNSIRLLA